MIVRLELCHVDREMTSKIDTFTNLGFFDNVQNALQELHKFKFTDSDYINNTHVVLSVGKCGIRENLFVYKYFKLNRLTKKLDECSNPFKQFLEEHGE